MMTMINHGIPRNLGAVTGGLLCLGDPRVCELIIPVRDKLTREQIVTVTHCFSGLMYKCVVEFYLDWLDKLVDQQDYESLDVFGNVAAGLTRHAWGQSPVVIDGIRPFPVQSGQWAIREIDRSEFSATIADRLYDLEGREHAPKVMPHVIRAFGLVPKSSPKDVALMQ